MKQCRICGESFPATNEYFHRSKKSRDGLNTCCKPCNRSKAKEWRDSNLDKARETDKQKYERIKRENPSILKERAQKSRAKEGYKEQRAKWHKEDRVNNPDKYKDRYQTKGKPWRSNNRARVNLRRKEREAKRPELRKVEKQRRRARERQLPDTFTPQDWQRCVEYFDGCCAVCGRPPGLWHTLAADHWVAISAPDCKGTIPENIVPLCHSKKDDENGCNNSKGSRNAEEWLKWKFGQRKASQILKKIREYFEWVKPQEDH